MPEQKRAIQLVKGTCSPDSGSVLQVWGKEVDSFIVSCLMHKHLRVKMCYKLFPSFPNLWEDNYQQFWQGKYDLNLIILDNGSN